MNRDDFYFFMIHVREVMDDTIFQGPYSIYNTSTYR